MIIAGARNAPIVLHTCIVVVVFKLNLGDAVMSNKEALLKMMQNTSHEMAIETILESDLLPDDLNSMFLNGVVERSIHRVYEAFEGHPVWRPWGRFMVG